MDANCNRREFKFLIRPELEPVTRNVIAGFLAPDRGLSSGYVVLTEYFDSSDLLCHWQKIDGIPNRRRLRSRIYVDPTGQHESVAFIEIKHKLDGLTVKRRTISTPEEVATFSSGGVLAPRTHNCEKVRHEITRLTSRHQLSPRAQIRYHRHAYDNGPEGTLRITFDHDIRCRVAELRPLSVNDSDFEIPLAPGGRSLMEVKTIGPVPSWFRRLCGTLALTPGSFSKYSAALGMTPKSDDIPRTCRRSSCPAPQHSPITQTSIHHTINT